MPATLLIALSFDEYPTPLSVRVVSPPTHQRRLLYGFYFLLQACFVYGVSCPTGIQSHCRRSSCMQGRKKQRQRGGVWTVSLARTGRRSRHSRPSLVLCLSFTCILHAIPRLRHTTINCPLEIFFSLSRQPIFFFYSALERAVSPANQKLCALGPLI
ncbi:hypothetical protein CI102_2810 [Trichoderma harzianum]|nr:hypothetical protein CI102_2810 [Trichoderma harzianum]